MNILSNSLLILNTLYDGTKSQQTEVNAGHITRKIGPTIIGYKVQNIGDTPIVIDRLPLIKRVKRSEESIIINPNEIGYINRKELINLGAKPAFQYRMANGIIAMSKVYGGMPEIDIYDYYYFMFNDTRIAENHPSIILDIQNLISEDIIKKYFS